MNKVKLLSTLGLARKAGKVIHGESLVLESIQKQTAKIVFLATDSGINTTKRISDKATYYQIPLIHVFHSEELSHAIGKENRKVVAVISHRFMELMTPLL